MKSTQCLVLQEFQLDTVARNGYSVRRVPQSLHAHEKALQVQEQIDDACALSLPMDWFDP